MALTELHKARPALGDTVAALRLKSDNIRILVGPLRREYNVQRSVLCSASPYFQDVLQEGSSNMTTTPTTSPGGVEVAGNLLRLASEAPEMFELFLLWLHQRAMFRAFIDDAVASMQGGPAYSAFPSLQGESSRTALHWSLVHLHIFASLIGVPTLQDMAMDALQDMYLRCDWDVSPRFVRFLYVESDIEHSRRLRKWAVAMLAWTLHCGQAAEAAAAQFQQLLDESEELSADYWKHIQKMTGTKADLTIKNPQLRLPKNKLRNEERFFGFRQCSFHSHRATVGEGICPHVLAETPYLCSPRFRSKEDVESEDSASDADILSPVSGNTGHATFDWF